MRMKKLLVALMALTMLATSLIGNVNITKASTGDDVYSPQELNLIVKPGETTHIKFPIQAKNATLLSATAEVKADDADAPFTFSRPSITILGSKASSVNQEYPVDIEFDVKVKETAEIKSYPITITFTGYPVFGYDVATYTMKTTLKVQEEKVPAQLTASNVVLGDSNIGSDTQLSFTVKNEGEITAKNVYMQMDFGDGILERYTAKDIKIGDLAAGETKDITLPISILSTATPGRRTVKANFTYKTIDGDEITGKYYNMYIELNATSTSAPKLKLADIQYENSYNPGDKFKIALELENDGEGIAKDISVSVDGSGISEDGILRDYYTDGIEVETIKKEAKKTVNIPLMVSKYATGGLKPLKITITYKDEAGLAYSLSNTIYIDVVGEAVAGTPNILIKNVDQYPAQPVAGEKVEVSFDLYNNSNIDATELKISVTGLTNDTFIPVNADPYQYYEKLEAGKTLRVTIPLTVSKNIQEGLNNLTVKCEYKGGDVTATIPVRNVVNEVGSVSMPKLIVSNYVTDVEELRAGNTFNLTFDIYNTHSSIAAKNITVTLSNEQGQSIFGITKGSDSFFINKVDPGETVSNTIELKIKSDTKTATYKYIVTIEYEWDGAVLNEKTGKIGDVRSQELTLAVIENSRPVVDYVNVYSWEGMVTVGSIASLSFEFYNMGKSPLNNVVATVEGDFMKANGNMQFIGSVMESGSSYVEFEVIPNVEGTATGVIVITFEDSNGDKVEYRKEFSAEVMSAGSFDPGFPPDGDYGEVFNPGEPTAKKEILPLWLFIVIQVAIFIIFVPVIRIIIINVYKAKLRRKEMEQYQ